jgi:hypothetical protein
MVIDERDWAFIYLFLIYFNKFQNILGYARFAQTLQVLDYVGRLQAHRHGSVQ